MCQLKNIVLDTIPHVCNNISYVIKSGAHCFENLRFSKELSVDSSSHQIKTCFMIKLIFSSQ